MILAQRLDHQAETAAQQRQFGHRRHGQDHVVLAAPDLVRRSGQQVDGRAEAAGDAMGGEHADDQYRHADQGEQGGDQL